MTIKTAFTGALLALIMAFPAFATAARNELGEPVVALMPHVKAMRADLGLNAQQNSTLDNWIAEAPARRKQLEGETLAVKKQLREAILDDADRKTREELKAELAAKMTRLVEMRALCTRMLRNTLTEEQFAKVVAAYRAGIDS